MLSKDSVREFHVTNTPLNDVRINATQSSMVVARSTDLREQRVDVMLQADINRLVFDRCALCDRSSELQASHIIPGFVFDWLKNTSASGHLRFAQSPNLRVQDGLKPRMLCEDCEQLLSSWEKRFSEECFVPLNDGSTSSIDYGSWMLKFAASVSWRVLRIFIAVDGLADFPGHIAEEANNALERWSRFLLGKEPNPGRNEQHMLLFDLIDQSSVPELPLNINRYLVRTIDAQVAFVNDDAISYAKMGRFVLFGFVAMKHPRRWEGTKLHVRHGRFGQRDVELPSTVGEFILERARLAGKSYSQISERQHERIRTAYVQNPDQVARSETLRAMHQDVLMFGMKAFDATQPRASDNLGRDKVDTAIEGPGAPVMLSAVGHGPQWFSGGTEAK